MELNACTGGCRAASTWWGANGGAPHMLPMCSQGLFPAVGQGLAPAHVGQSGHTALPIDVMWCSKFAPVSFFPSSLALCGNSPDLKEEEQQGLEVWGTMLLAEAGHGRAPGGASSAWHRWP